jgi:hypothetical protein
MIHLVAVIVLIISFLVALVVPEKKKLPIIGIGGLVAWIMIVSKLTLEYL